jgi:hypothetical protein
LTSWDRVLERHDHVVGLLHDFVTADDPTADRDGGPA